MRQINVSCQLCLKSADLIKLFQTNLFRYFWMPAFASITSLYTILISSPVFALPSDIKEKMIIVADHSIYNYKTGIKTFEGNVKLDQGFTHLRADRLITKDNKQHQMQEAIAYGLKDKAHYWTLPKAGEAEIHADAQIIKYYPPDANITLEQNVHVTQGENSFQGQLIHYNMNDEVIAVPASENGRAVVIYNPDKINR